MKQNMQEVITGLPEPARVLVLAKAQEWRVFAGDVVRIDEQPVSDGRKFVLTFEYGSIGTVITSSGALQALQG